MLFWAPYVPFLVAKNQKFSQKHDFCLSWPIFGFGTKERKSRSENFRDSVHKNFLDCSRRGEAIRVFVRDLLIYPFFLLLRIEDYNSIEFP